MSTPDTPSTEAGTQPKARLYRWRHGRIVNRSDASASYARDILVVACSPTEARRLAERHYGSKVNLPQFCLRPEVLTGKVAVLASEILVAGEEGESETQERLEAEQRLIQTLDAFGFTPVDIAYLDFSLAFMAEKVAPRIPASIEEITSAIGDAIQNIDILRYLVADYQRRNAEATARAERSKNGEDA